MGEITSEGYQTLRDYANSSTATPSSWDYIEIYDDTDTAVTRVSISGDSRCQWMDVDGDPILKVEASFTGSDSDISVPVTLQKAAIWNSASGGSQITQKEQFAQVPFNQDGDNTVITHVIEIPQQ